MSTVGDKDADPYEKRRAGQQHSSSTVVGSQPFAMLSVLRLWSERRLFETAAEEMQGTKGEI